MQSFVFVKVTTHYATVQAETLEQAQQQVQTLQVFDDEVDSVTDEDWVQSE